MESKSTIHDMMTTEKHTGTPNGALLQEDMMTDQEEKVHITSSLILVKKRPSEHFHTHHVKKEMMAGKTATSSTMSSTLRQVKKKLKTRSHLMNTSIKATLNIRMQQTRRIRHR